MQPIRITAKALAANPRELEARDLGTVAIHASREEQSRAGSDSDFGLDRLPDQEGELVEYEAARDRRARHKVGEPVYEQVAEANRKALEEKRAKEEQPT